MTNAKAVAVLQVILGTERQWKEFYARLSDRNGKRLSKAHSVRVAALEHAITELEILQTRTGEA